MAAMVRRFARVCLGIAAVRTNRTSTKLSISNGRPYFLIMRSVAGCTEQCCRDSPLRCWKCNAVHVNGHPEYFCHNCEVIQPPEEHISYFEILESPETFAVDVSQLHKTYRDLQFRLHPDRFSKCTAEEQHLSALHSSMINKAYNTILKPLGRGTYLLKLHGISVEQGDTISSPEFLMEIMELNERLEDITSSEDMQKIETEIKSKISDGTQELSDEFHEGDYNSAKDKLIQLKYYMNIASQIKDRISSMDLAGEH